MNHTTSIIHLKRDFERRPLIAAVRDTIPDAKMFFGFEPVWEPQKDTRSIRGSSVSHLQCYEQHGTTSIPHLVLEDDVIVNQEGWADFLKMDKLPDDCGVLLLGAETPNFFGAGNGLYEVAVPFHGAHGVLYNSPVLHKTEFLKIAYQHLSTTELSDKAACYEGILDVSMRQLGLRMYRMETMAFGTAPVVSGRVGKVLPPRSVEPVQCLQKALSQLSKPKELSSQKPAIPYYE